jgi:hypothetical protein
VLLRFSALLALRSSFFGRSFFKKIKSFSENVDLALKVQETRKAQLMAFYEVPKSQEIMLQQKAMKLTKAEDSNQNPFWVMTLASCWMRGLVQALRSILHKESHLQMV